MEDDYETSLIPLRCGQIENDNDTDIPIDTHFRLTMETLNNLRASKMLTDLMIICGSKRISVHKCVLAAGSKYFKALFTNSMQETTSSEPLTLNNVDESSLEAVIDYIYTGKIDLNEGNYLQIMDTANQLELPVLVNSCCDFVLQNLDMENCLAVHALGEQYSCLSLSVQAEQHIFRYFAEVVETEDYLTLPFDRLSMYLQHDELSVPSEEAVFRAIVRWIEYDPDTRSTYIGSLLNSVRLQLIPKEFIATNVHKYPPIKSSELATQLVLDAYQWHCLPESEKPGSRKQFLRNKAIYPTIYIFGGDDGINDGSPYSMVMHLEKNQQEWVGVEKMRRARSVFGSAVIRNNLYCVGGFDGERAIDSAEVFDCATNTWQLLPPLLQRRCSCSCAVLKGQLYVIGGVCGPLALSHVEKYDSVSRVWMPVTPLSETRSACGVASIGDSIYVVGGINSRGATINTGEVYSHATQEWREIAQMNERRRSLALCALNGQLYAIGGNNGSHDLRSCEVYDPIKNVWRPIQSMLNARMYCSAATYMGEIYSAGGVEESSTLTSIERYNPTTGIWTPFIALPRMMCGSGMQVLDSVPLPLLNPSRRRKALHVDALLEAAKGTTGTSSTEGALAGGGGTMMTDTDAASDDQEQSAADGLPDLTSLQLAAGSRIDVDYDEADDDDNIDDDDDDDDDEENDGNEGDQEEQQDNLDGDENDDYTDETR